MWKLYYKDGRYIVEKSQGVGTDCLQDDGVIRYYGYGTNDDYAFTEATRDAEVKNKMIKEGELRVTRCKDCGRYFEQYRHSIEWFERKRLCLPKKCKECRKKK